MTGPMMLAWRMNPRSLGWEPSVAPSLSWPRRIVAGHVVEAGDAVGEELLVALAQCGVITGVVRVAVGQDPRVGATLHDTSIFPHRGNRWVTQPLRFGSSDRTVA